MDTQRSLDGGRTARFLILSLVCLALFFFDLAFGSVRIPIKDLPAALVGGSENPAWTTIVHVFRLPKAITAAVAGAGLAVAGLVLQSLFRNPLAGPDSLGIGAGASIGAGIVVIFAGGVGSSFLAELGLAGYSLLALAAALGAGAVLSLVLAVSRRVHSAVSLLIVGILVGYFAGAILSLLIFFASPQKIQVYLGWTYGSFGGVTWSRLPVFVGATLLGLGLLVRSTKALDALLLGDRLSASLGLDPRRIRRRVLVASALLAGAVTAFCGPIAFLGIAAPQGAKRYFRSSAHRVTLPGAALVGAFFALLADLVSQLAPGGLALPVNPLLALFGAPIILSVVLRATRSEPA